MNKPFRKLKALLVSFFIVIFWAGVGFPAENTAKYIFLFIGDGMSIPQRGAAELYLTGLNSPKDLMLALLREQGKFHRDNGVADFNPSVQRLLMNTFPAQGLQTTYSANALITDSSSSATAMATGRKTRDGVVGMDPSARENYVSMAKLARDKGMKVGVISTVSIEHATPAAFYASLPNRRDYYEIALQIPESRFNFFGGGGFNYPRGAAGDRKDVAEALNEAGYKVYDTREGFGRITAGDDMVVTINPVLDTQAALPYAIDKKEGEISLAEFVAKGIEVLDNPNGFFMMAEGGKIDWACHANDAVAAINDVLSLDEAVSVAYEFYRKRPNETLIVVTGDHETGGMTIGYAGTRYDLFLMKLKAQKGSYLAFNEKFAAFKKANPNAKLEDFLPLAESFYGLKRHDRETMEKLGEQAKKGDGAAYEALGMALGDHEMEVLASAFDMSMKDHAERPVKSDEYYISYGTYEPITITLTRILNRKAGIGWTTYSHTGLPVPVSAIGVGHERFNGYYDNTDIFKKIVTAGGL